MPSNDHNVRWKSIFTGPSKRDARVILSPHGYKPHCNTPNTISISRHHHIMAVSISLRTNYLAACFVTQYTLNINSVKCSKNFTYTNTFSRLIAMHYSCRTLESVKAIKRAASKKQTAPPFEYFVLCACISVFWNERIFILYSLILNFWDFCRP